MFKYLLLLFFSSISFADNISFQCKFEEVYDDGQVQQGLLLVSNGNLRYEYLDKNLYTLIYKKNNLYLIRNAQKNLYEKVQKNSSLFNSIVKVFNDYPNFESRYEESENVLILEKSKNNNFVRRIGVSTSKLNLSIYLNDCESKEINGKFFNFNPFFDLKI